MVKSSKPKYFYGYVIVASAFLIIAMTWGSLYTFGVFFKPLLAEFSWTRAMTSGALSLGFFLIGLLGIFAGRLNDRFGPRLVITTCGIFLGLGYLLISQVSAIWQLYLFYGVMIGVGLSGVFVPLASTIARWFVKRRGMMTGIALAGVGAGTLVMSSLANWLITSYGWRTSYIVMGIAVLVLVTLTAQLLKRDPGKIGQLPYGKNELDREKTSYTIDYSLREVVRVRQFWMMVVIFFCFGLGIGVVLAHIVLHVIGLEISAAKAASVLATIGALSIVGRIILGIVGDRIGNKKALIICTVLMSAALFGALVAAELPMLYLFAVIFGLGYGGVPTLQSSTLAEQFGLTSHGVILGITELAVTAGETVGPVLAGYIFDVTGSYNLAFLIAAIASFISLVLVLQLKPVARKERIGAHA